MTLKNHLTVKRFFDKNGESIVIGDEVLAYYDGVTMLIKVTDILRDGYKVSAKLYDSEDIASFISSNKVEKIPKESREQFLMLKVLEGHKIVRSEDISRGNF